jgi:hypothetical protein
MSRPPPSGNLHHSDAGHRHRPIPGDSASTRPASNGQIVESQKRTESRISDSLLYWGEVGLVRTRSTLVERIGASGCELRRASGLGLRVAGAAAERAHDSARSTPARTRAGERVPAIAASLR